MAEGPPPDQRIFWVIWVPGRSDLYSEFTSEHRLHEYLCPPDHMTLCEHYIPTCTYPSFWGQEGFSRQVLEPYLLSNPCFCSCLCGIVRFWLDFYQDISSEPLLHHHRHCTATAVTYIRMSIFIYVYECTAAGGDKHRHKRCSFVSCFMTSLRQSLEQIR